VRLVTIGSIPHRWFVEGTEMNVERQQRTLAIVADDLRLAQFVSSVAGRAGWRTVSHRKTDEGIAATLVGRVGLEAVLIDQERPEDNPCELVRAIRAAHPQLAILVATSGQPAAIGTELVRAGATDFISKPLERDTIVKSLRLAMGREATPGELQPLSEELRIPQRFEDMIGTDRDFRKALARAAKSARSQRHVIVQGEIGTGKDMLLRAMHAASPRAGSRLEILRVRSHQGAALDSELFGHHPGAFPGAFGRKVGALEKSDGGTLLIEEVNRLPLENQERLAAAIADSRIKPLGSPHNFLIDVRFFATTSLPVSELVNRGELSAALLEALDPVQIALPPLRQRKGDIPALARYFLSSIKEQPGLADLVLTDSALGILCSFDWPGNVRQLQAVLFRAAIACQGEALRAEHFAQLSSEGRHEPSPAPIESSQTGVVLFDADGHLRSLEDLEADIIRFAIGHYRGRMSEVARRLGIGRSTLYRKLADLGLEVST
jgi:DNA-binding NtrC family response regulator